jgi:hypothetical protein
MSVVPRTIAFPRFVARITVGAIGDSRSALRYVKHSMSSMWTCGNGLSDCTYTIQMRAANLIDEDHARDDLRNALIDIALYNLVHFSSKFLCDLGPAALHQAAHDTHNVLPPYSTPVRIRFSMRGTEENVSCLAGEHSRRRDLRASRPAPALFVCARRPWEEARMFPTPGRMRRHTRPTGRPSTLSCEQ